MIGLERGAQKPLSKTSGNLLYNLIYFGRLLRALGVDTQPDGITNLVKATAWIPIERKQDFYRAARSLLIRRRQDLAAFDHAFEKFWQARAGWKPETESGIESQTTIEYDPHASETTGSDAVSVAPRIRYSPAEALRHKDFAELDSEELERVKPLLAKLQWKLGQRHTRRWQRGRATTSMRAVCCARASGMEENRSRCFAESTARSRVGWW